MTIMVQSVPLYESWSQDYNEGSRYILTDFNTIWFIPKYSFTIYMFVNLIIQKYSDSFWGAHV